MYKIHYKVWLEKEGKVFGKGPFLLLKGVEDFGSLAEAAKNLSMSYNKAHNLVKDIEERLGFSLIHKKAGGLKGGGSELTDEARFLMRKYEEFQTELEHLIENLEKKYFD